MRGAALILPLLAVQIADTFTLRNYPSKRLRMVAEEGRPAALTRKTVLGAICGIAAASAAGTPAASAFEIYEKGAEIQGEIFKKDRLERVKENLVEIKASATALEKFADLIDTGDYQGLRAGLRIPPFAGIRTYSRNVILYSDEPAKSQVEAAYKTFIASIERMDRTAMLLAKQRNPARGDPELTKEYQSATKLMEGFISLVDAE